MVLHTITAEEAGQRIDNFLMRHFKAVPRSRVYRLLRKGEVRVNRKRVDAEYRIAAGDEVRLPPVRIDSSGEPGRPSHSLVELIERAVIFQDKHLLVINKPAGVAVHGGSGMSYGVIEALRASRPPRDPRARASPRPRHQRLSVGRPRSGNAHRASRPDPRFRHAQDLSGSGRRASWQLGTKRIDAPLATDNRQHGERHVRVAAAGKDSVSVFKPVQFFGKPRDVDGGGHSDRAHAPNSRPRGVCRPPAAGRRQIWRSRAQCEVQAVRIEAHISARAVGGIRVAGVRRALSRQRAAAGGAGRGARCDDTAAAQASHRTARRKAAPRR